MSAFFVGVLSSAANAARLDCPPDRIDARIDTRVQVATIYDGDTVRLKNGDKVRFIGINTPELGYNGKPSQPFARKAKNRLDALLRQHNYRINLRYGDERHDRYGRLLAHAYLPDNRSINAILLQEGLAARITIPPNVRDFRCYRAAEKFARDEKRGIWSLQKANGVAVKTLTKKTRGFNIINGEVTNTRNYKGNIYIELGGAVTLRIDSTDTKYFAPDFTRSLVGKRLRVRGWVRHKSGKWQMRLRHPANVELE